MSVLIESLGGIESAKKYLNWMKENNLMMGSFNYKGGLASFYDFTLENAIEKYEMENKA